MAAYHYQQGDRPLDGYTIQYALGRGGFGEVYYAVSDSGREVALKAVQNFEDVELRGIGHCMNLKSPHLVMIFDIKHATDGTPWVIMEYVSGPSLRDILDESPQGLSVDQVVFFLKELATGLSYLHEAGVVHRDLKPHNVFFEDGIVKIGDYSLSKVITASHRSGNTMTVGSVHYMAPEISMGRYDKTVDVYALGVMLYEMLTGQPPYVGESMGEVLMKHLNSVPDVSDVAKPFAGVIRKAMDKDPAARFQTAEEMIKALGDSARSSDPADSFNPATLSLVGERARRARANESQSAAPTRQANPSAAPEFRHSTAPTAAATQETEIGAATSGELLPPRKVSWLQLAGLHYSPADRLHSVRDSVPLVVRLCLASLVATGLVMFGWGWAWSGSWEWWWGMGWRWAWGWAWADTLASVVVIVVLAAGSTAVGCRVLPLYNSFASVVQARIPWCFPWAVAVSLASHFRLAGLGPQSAQILFPVLAALIIPDWRCLLAPDRHVRVSPVATVIVGVIAALAAAAVPHYVDRTLFCTVATMAVALIVQLVAPLCQTTTDAPANAVAQPPKKPRLLFDRMAMVQELVAGASAVVIAAALATGLDDEETVVVMLIGVFVGVSALRFRLQRRAWPTEQKDKHGGSRLLFDRPAIVMELLVGAAATIVVGLLIGKFVKGSIDEELVVFGVVAAGIGLFALRFRLQRRLWPDESGETKVAVTEQPAVNQQRDGEVPLKKKTEGLDKRSLMLEAIIITAAAIIGCLINEGDEELFPLGAALAVIGLLALRYRFQRYRYQLAGDQLPKQRLSFDIISIVLELFIGCCAVYIAAVIAGGHDAYFGLAIAAGALGIIAIRLRLVRRVSWEETVNELSPTVQEGIETQRRNDKQEIHQ